MKRAMRRMRKYLVVVACIALVAGLAIGGTVAWLADSTQNVVNTFTPSNVGVDLTETTTDYEMVPGQEIAKDPQITVDADSETSYVFVEVTKSDNVDTFLDYTLADGWMEVTGEENVYYRIFNEGAATKTFDVLSGNQVTVKNTVTKTQMNALTDTTRPQLTFKAYIIQKAGFNTAEDAWEQLEQETWAEGNGTYGANTVPAN